ncbi:hemerythrin family protein [Citrifermentans bemidjiense Bem]|uniref:Hemerythrin family protein n=1 Tax=Citrifermentans bemidjiense (strain ATCC BAA-1014 / DSM 16622 / JCM 12645 / Bem) TaxID=404380 RepID=B5EI07_CITBB|nr:hemerythrin family protein [Citrifermentans bemidjiense]ACH38271.1 hemerythrin family protein [Citrifermentans bemidjiense Bem]
MAVGWQDNLSIGVLEVDIQHKLLFDKFNSFLNAYAADGNTDQTLQMFWFLEAYAVTHFNEEEKLMLQAGYPALPAHRQKHQAFIDQINQLKERLKVEGLNQALVTAMTSFITSWLIQHISTEDRAIGDFINKRPAGYVSA